ncbi:MAG: hypothetical protein R3B60_03730 [Candidatus Paceibacterota bacterium]
MSLTPRIFLMSLPLLFLPLVSLAYNPSINTTTIPYELTSINSDIQTKYQYLGELKNDPHMYEFNSSTTTELTLSLAQLATNLNSPIPFSLIVVKEKEKGGGVQEVGRLNQKNIEWNTISDGKLGLKLKVSNDLSVKVTSGTYRIEVSTPENRGKYMLTIGQDDSNHSYFSELLHIKTINSFLDDSFFSIFRSSYVYYPLGIITITILFYLVWRKRQRVKTNFNNVQNSN